MPGNSIRINGCDRLEWYVGDSHMEKVIAVLDEVGSKTQDEYPRDIPEDYGRRALSDLVPADADTGVFIREELQRLREKAKNMSEIEGTNPSWARAYLGIADACNRLDAMMARCEDKEEIEISEE